MASLQPPSKGVELVDSGTHDLEEAIEERTSSASGASTHVPKLQLQTVDEDLNTSEDSEAPPSTPGGLPIPMTVVEKVEPSSPSHGEVPGTVAYDMRKMDAEPDAVREAPDITRADLEGLPTFTGHRSSEDQTRPDPVLDAPADNDSKVEEDSTQSGENEDEARNTKLAPGLGDETPSNMLEENDDENENEDEDGFGDDFDDFEEGAQDDDFGAFDEAADDVEFGETAASTVPAQNTIPQHPTFTLLPLVDYDALDGYNEIAAACRPYLRELFPSRNAEYDEEEEVDLPAVNPAFLSERSQSLWAQLVAPPPLQPPDWVRSRIRRLFLVSLGVPVDLDEILPASKQKRLVLPSLHVETERSHGRTPDTPTHGSSTKPADQQPSTTSLEKTTSKQDRKRGPATPPEFDINSTRHLCSMTDTALASLATSKLQAHVLKLRGLTQQASDALESWLMQKDSALGDKQAFEEVIENLVKHAQKIRK